MGNNKSTSGIKEYLIKELPNHLSYVFKASKPYFIKIGDEEILKFENIPNYLIIPPITLNEIYHKWEETKYDINKTTDWVSEKVLTKLYCNPEELKSNKVGKVIVLMGHTGSGKTTLKNMLIEHQVAEGITTYTTREPRKEESAFCYHFIEKDDFNDKVKQNFFLETSSALRKFTIIEDNGEITRKEELVYFGSAKKDYEGESLKVIVLDASGYLNIKDKIKCIPVFINVDKETIIDRCQQRGDSEDKILNRMKNDDFTKLDNLNIYHINGNLNINQVYDELFSLILKEGVE